MAEFRAFETADLATVLDMMRAYRAEDGLEFDSIVANRGLAAIAAGTSLARLWLIEQDDRPIGYLCVTAGFSLEVGGGDFFLDEIFVRPEWRGRGLGRAALAFAESAARAQGALRICLEVTRRNDRARRLYASLDYTAHDRDLMSKDLSKG